MHQSLAEGFQRKLPLVLVGHDLLYAAMVPRLVGELRLQESPHDVEGHARLAAAKLQPMPDCPSSVTAQ